MWFHSTLSYGHPPPTFGSNALNNQRDSERIIRCSACSIWTPGCWLRWCEDQRKVEGSSLFQVAAMLPLFIFYPRTPLHSSFSAKRLQIYWTPVHHVSCLALLVSRSRSLVEFWSMLFPLKPHCHCQSASPRSLSPTLPLSLPAPSYLPLGISSPI